MEHPTTEQPATAPAFGLVEQLVSHAFVRVADQQTAAADLIQQAMGLAFELFCEHPDPTPPVDLTGWTVPACIEAALAEVQSWDLTWVNTDPTMTPLKVLLADARRALRDQG